jgi:hypothetical protein
MKKTSSPVSFILFSGLLHLATPPLLPLLLPLPLALPTLGACDGASAGLASNRIGSTSTPLIKLDFVLVKFLLVPFALATVTASRCTQLISWIIISVERMISARSVGENMDVPAGFETERLSALC